MRFDTVNASSYLVWRLQNAGIIRDLHDDGDLIYVELTSREKLMIYLVERPMTLIDVQHHLQTNTQKGLHTLFLFWIDMLLPRDGTRYYPDDWMQAVMSLHGNRIYGFEVAGQEAYFLPIHFEGRGYERMIRYGGIVDYGKLTCRRVATKISHLTGTWRVADFQPNTTHATQQASRHPLIERDPTALQHFKILGINITSDKTLIKTAYHALARRHHPDVDKTGEGTTRMKHINNAYRALIRLIDGHEK